MQNHYRLKIWISPTTTKTKDGPNVCVLEEVLIRSNTIIGAGSIVPKDLQNNSTYVGNPAKRIEENKHPEFIKNPWIKSMNNSNII